MHDTPHKHTQDNAFTVNLGQITDTATQALIHRMSCTKNTVSYYTNVFTGSDTCDLGLGSKFGH